MLQKYKAKREEGFTIIEVLIVLAIAGLIILIVFLAVPALQRNSRNTQRTNDASLVSAAISECLNNNNGQAADCGKDNTDKLQSYLDETKLQQLTAADGPTLNAYLIEFEKKCNAEGSESEDGGGGRSFTVAYQVETTGDPVGRCIGS